MINHSNVATLPGVISGTGSLAQIGTGTTTLTGDNTYTGGTTISAGTLQLGNGGTTGSVVGNVIDNGNLNFNRSDVVTFPGLISGTGTVAQTGSGITLLTNQNTYTGGTTISAGTLELGNGGTTGSIVGNVTDNGRLSFNRSDVVTFPGLISGTGSLAQTATATTTLTNNNIYTGGTTISHGTLELGNGGTSGSVVGNITNNAALVINRSNEITLTGVISGTGSLAQIGTGTTILTGQNTYTGGTTISAGTLQLGNGGTTGSILGNVSDNGTLSFNRSDVVTFPGLISGTGAVTQTGTGTTILTNNNTYTGGTTISHGTLELGNGGTTGSIVGNITDDAALVVNRSNAFTLPGVISGTGSLAQVGTGTTTLTGNNTFTGITTITAGTLQLGNGGTTGGLVGNIVDDTGLVINRSGSLKLPGTISGQGTLTQVGPGSTTLTGPNSYSGGTIIQDGSLIAVSASALGSGSVLIEGPDSILNAQKTQITNSGTPQQSPVTVLNGGTALIQGGSIRAVAGAAIAVGGSQSSLDTVSLTGTSISSPAAAILATGTSNANISINGGTTLTPGNGILLQGNSTGATNVGVNNNALTGNIQVVTGTANIVLNNPQLTGWINQNALTGAFGVNPNDPPSAFNALPPSNVNLSLDPSTWTMTASSTLNTLSVTPGSRIIFSPPATGGPFKTLVTNNLLGTRATFAMNVDLPVFRGDLLVVSQRSEGAHLVSFNNQPQDVEVPANRALLVVQTSDGASSFQGEADAGTFRIQLVRGNSSTLLPNQNSWYLFREGQPVPPPTPPPPTPPPVPPSEGLTNTANAAIGTYSSTIPLFYADMQTLVQRVGRVAPVERIGACRATDDYDR